MLLGNHRKNNVLYMYMCVTMMYTHSEYGLKKQSSQLTLSPVRLVLIHHHVLMMRWVARKPPKSTVHMCGYSE